MRLRFSLRDLLWLELVVALGMGWFVREHALQAAVTEASNRAREWRLGAGGLKRAVESEGWKVDFDFVESKAVISQDGEQDAEGEWRSVRNHPLGSQRPSHVSITAEFGEPDAEH